MLQRNLKMQQKFIAKRKPTTYYESTYDKEILNMYTQEVNTLQEKTVAKDGKMSPTTACSTTSYNVGGPAVKQKNCSSMSNLVCQFPISYICILYVKLSSIP